MPETLSKGTKFDPELVKDLISKVKGISSLAIMSKQEPIPFNGSKQFIFTMDNEIDIVAENGKKSAGGISLAPVVMMPIKVEYGARVSDEFMIADEEQQLETLKSFNDGFAKKLAKGIDLAAIHGVNPRTGQASGVVGENNFDDKVTKVIDFDEILVDANIEEAINKLEDDDKDVNALIMAPAFRQALANLKNASNERLYPELAWGGNPSTINGLRTNANKTVSYGDSGDRAITGDFENMFKWGYARDITMEVIQYGDPDNSGMDLKGYGQVYIRAEAYIGWGIFDGDSFAIIRESASDPEPASDPV